MATNKYFNQYGIDRPNQEQELIHNWTREAIQVNGTDVWYIKRTFGKLDNFFGEDTLSTFTEKFKIEMYIENIDRWAGMNDILTEFGSVAKDQVDLHVSSRRFKEETGMNYPKEGDLIWMPFFNRALWEIKFVEEESQFYPLGTLPSFKLRATHFDLSGEDFDTGLDDLDNKTDEFNRPQDLDELEETDNPDNKDIETEADSVVVEEDNVWGKF